MACGLAEPRTQPARAGAQQRVLSGACAALLRFEHERAALVEVYAPQARCAVAVLEGDGALEDVSVLRVVWHAGCLVIVVRRAGRMFCARGPAELRHRLYRIRQAVTRKALPSLEQG